MHPCRIYGGSPGGPTEAPIPVTPHPPAQVPPLPSASRSAALVALAYVTVGILWILLSDWALAVLIPSQELYALVQTWKGSAFVLVTGLLLFFLLRHQYARRSRRTEELREANHRLNLHVENTPLALVEWDRDLRVVRWSPRAEEIFGWREDEVRGLDWRTDPGWRFVVEEDLPAVDRTVEQSLEENASGSYSLNRNHRKDGSIIWCEWYNSWVFDSEGEVASMMSLVHDVTAEREATDEVRRLNQELEARVHRRTEQLAQANADMKALNYSISHDLRAPVRAVLGFGQILERRYSRDFPPEAREYLGHILQAGGHMDLLIDGLLEFGRLESPEGGAAATEAGPVALEVVREVEAAAPEAKGTIQVSEPLPTLPMDRTSLRRVLHNLLGNAVKYRDPSRPLQVRVSGRSNGNGTRLQVEDNGPGIPEEHRDRLFRLFERMHRQEDIPGAGVGLAVVRKSVELAGGTVSIQPSELGGAAFELAFPSNERRGT
ncbi:MAG: PAS domain-containing sensor histidine kinase [Gemmatimonadales bacterium]|nr:MAG: PAS domain-containing sensor histidine kinase [Gemmatimonadales bacterium]